MKNFSFVLILHLCCFVAQAQLKASLLKTYGGPDYEYPTAVCADSAGNIFVAASYDDRLTMCGEALPVVVQPPTSNQTANLTVSMFDRTGECIWTRVGVSRVPLDMGGPMGPEIRQMQYFNGRIYCAGVFSDTMIFGEDTLHNPSCVSYCQSSFCIVLDTTGGIVWSHCFSGSTNYAQVGEITPYAGGLFVTGLFQDSLMVDSVVLTSSRSWGEAGYLLSFDNDGRCRWGKNIGESIINSAYAHVYDGETSIYICGNYRDSIVFPGVTLRDSSNVYRSPYFTKYDTSGNFIWALGGLPYLKAEFWVDKMVWFRNEMYFLTNATGNVRMDTFEVTTPSGIYQDFAGKLSPDGDLIWLKNFSQKMVGSSYWSPTMTVSPTGPLIASSFSGTVPFASDTLVSNGDSDILLYQLDKEGDVQYHQSFGSAYQDLPRDLFWLDSSLYFVSALGTTLELDGKVVTPTGNGDILLVRFGPDRGGSSGMSDPGDKSVFQVFPNPTSGSVTLTGDNKQPVVISIFSSTGQLVESVTAEPGEQIPTTHLPDGLYVLEITSGENAAYVKLVVRH